MLVVSAQNRGIEQGMCSNQDCMRRSGHSKTALSEQTSACQDLENGPNIGKRSTLVPSSADGTAKSVCDETMMRQKHEFWDMENRPTSRQSTTCGS